MKYNRLWLKPAVSVLFLTVFCYLYSVEYYDTITDFAIIKVIDWANSPQKRDTFIINIANVPDVFSNNIAVRIRGIDTPELNDKRECLAKSYDGGVKTSW